MSFLVLHFTFMPTIHLELIFIKYIRSVSRFIFYVHMFSCSPLRILKPSDTECLARTLIYPNASVIILCWVFFHSDQICQTVTDYLITGEQGFQKFIDKLDIHFVSFSNKWIKVQKNILFCKRQNKLSFFPCCLIYLNIFLMALKYM